MDLTKVFGILKIIYWVVEAMQKLSKRKPTYETQANEPQGIEEGLPESIRRPRR